MTESTPRDLTDYDRAIVAAARHLDHLQRAGWALDMLTWVSRTLTNRPVDYRPTTD